ncbi:cyclic nucleotide-binding domain-containing protein 2-like [Lineus longissimus]|uniref:cyclic nucleotide-binding domain-containing protein 2-like n=1 Tax=Lineus longissimus TaxID=88925 RepID=UPI002B4E3916
MALDIRSRYKSSGVLFKTLLEPVLEDKPRHVGTAARHVPTDINAAKGTQRNKLSAQKSRGRRFNTRSENKQLLLALKNRSLRPAQESKVRAPLLPYLRQEVETPQTRKFKILVRRGRRGSETIKEWNVKGDFDISELKKEEIIEEVPSLGMWRKYARLVKLMCGVCLALKTYSQVTFDLEKLTAGVSTKRTLTTGDNGDEKAEDIFFNPDDFKTKCEETWPTELIHVVEANPKNRTEEEVRSIKRVMSSLPSFRRYTKEMQNLLSKVVRYCKYGPKRVIIRKGHIGHSFYFIFSGAVQVVFDKEDISIFTKPEISVLKKGQVFGEIALLRHSVRNATIVCAEETELLAVDREEFNEYGLYDLFLKECQDRIEFMGLHHLCSTWQQRDIEDLCYVSRIEEYSYNKVIVKDARKSEWLYFVCKGTCEILRLVDLTKCEEFQHFIPPEKYPSRENNMPPIFLDMDSALQYLKKNWVPPRTTDQEKANYEMALQSGSSIGHIRPRSRLTVTPSEESQAETEQCSTRPASQNDKNGTKPKSPQSKQNIATAAVSKKRQSKTGGTEPESEYEYVGIGVFIKVDSLRPGDVFGLNNYYETPQFLSLISKGSEVIRVPQSKFKDFGGEVTLRKGRAMIRSYPSDGELCRSFLKQNTWNMFKQDLVELVRSDFPNSITPASQLHGCKDYFRRVSTSSACQRYPQAKITYTPEQLCGQVTNCNGKVVTRAVKSAAPRLISGAPLIKPTHVTLATAPRTRPKTAMPCGISGRGLFPVSRISNFSS